ncbi:MAG: LD-carboxypeptidase [Firmicutes bacterium]|nr:LD-carboxypeptidase [Bacillota bacterium]MCM1401022.1 LD-carboxypeptidase [Bacteroides sp.]MCM1476941.1 LD-carboxypeptidase [Bacteroides sp.]
MIDDFIIEESLIVPPFLKEGDKIAIVSPAGVTRSRNVYNALPVLQSYGWEPFTSPHAFGRHATFSGTPDERYADLEQALLDPEVKAILCSRGGYGAVHLLERLDELPLRDNAKWIIGFSDISALHALMHKHGIASIHGPMAKHIASHSGEDSDSQALIEILTGKGQTFEVAPNKLNRPGTATGPLLGGNMAVLTGLFGTPFNIFKPGSIMFIEDVSEPVYKIERMMYQLKLSGVLSQISGLIVGVFTEYSPDVDGRSMEEMIHELVADYDYPVAYGVPFGHGSRIIPFVEGVEATLTVSPDAVTISQPLDAE